jgi:hypothetical protein
MAARGSRTLKLTYLGDASQLSKSTRKAGDDVTTLGDRVKGVGKTLAVGFAAVGAAGIAMGKQLFDAFEQVSTANARVEQVITSMGNFEGQIGEVTDRLIKQAEATARLTGVDRNLIKESQALLLTFDSVNQTAGDAGSIFDRATQAAVDLAAAGFGSVTGNAQQLGRALEDPIKGLTALTRSGVTFTEEQRALIASLVEANRTFEAQDIVLQAIERQVGGVAEATANGSARIAQSFGILRDRIALELGPAFEFLVGKALEFVDRFGVWWDRNGDDIIDSFRRFGERTKELWQQFSTFVGRVRDALGSFGVFERLRNRAGAIATQFDATRQAFDTLLDGIVGPSAEEKATAFARLIDLGFVRPFEYVLGLVEELLGLLETLFRFADRVRSFPDVFRGFGDIGRFDLGEVDLFTGQTSGGGRPAPGITVNVTGAIDPEGTARVIRRTLDSSSLRVGQAPTPGLAAVA